MTATTSTPAPLATLDAVLERITYANEETGYTVARVATRGGGSDLLTVVGALLGAQTQSSHTPPAAHGGDDGGEALGTLGR